jgi:hypothetical protein
LCRSGKPAAKFTSCAGIGRRSENRKTPPASLRFLSVQITLGAAMYKDNKGESGIMPEQLLERPSLWLSVIINLSDGRPWNEFPYKGEGKLIRLNRHQELKDAIGAGVLPARIHPTGLDHRATVSLLDLIDFVEPRYRARSERWSWLRKFCTRWSTLADNTGQSSTRLSERILQATGVRSRPSHRPPSKLEAVVEVLQTFTSDQLSQKMESLVAEVNDKLPDRMTASKDTVRRALKKLRPAPPPKQKDSRTF